MNNSEINRSDSISLAQMLSMNCAVQMDSKTIKAQLSNYKSAVGFTRDAVKSFLDGKYADPLVGENACQIRAALYCDFARNEKVVEELQAIVRILEERPIDVAVITVPKKSSLGEVLQVSGSDVRISNEMSSILGPIVFGHILTVTKLSKLSIEKGSVALEESNSYERLVGITPTFAKELIKGGRRAVSNASISYLRREVDLLPMSVEREEIVSAMKEQVLTDQLGLQTAPALPGMKILLESMKVHGTAIVLKNRVVDGEKEGALMTMLFEPKGIGEPYRVVEDLTKVDEKGPVVVLEGIVVPNPPRDIGEIVLALRDVGIETIILANIAAHPQYGGMNKDKEPIRSEERERLKGVAKEIGLCAENPGLCRLYHIYAGTVRDHLQKEAV